MDERIGQIRKALNMTQEKFAERIGLTGNFVWMLEKGKRVPSDRTIADICREFNVSDEWLRTGNGEMFIELPKDLELEQVLGQIANSDDGTIKAIIKAYWGMDEKEKAVIRKLIDSFIENLQ